MNENCSIVINMPSWSTNEIELLIREIDQLVYKLKITVAKTTIATIIFYVQNITFSNVPLYCWQESYQIFHYTRGITPKPITSWRSPSPRHCARTTQLISKKCRSCGDPLATPHPIWEVRDSNLGPPAAEANALPWTSWPVRYYTYKTAQNQTNLNFCIHYQTKSDLGEPLHYFNWSKNFTELCF